MLPDVDTIAQLGGVLVNYHPVEDATTDLDADADNTNRGNVAMMTHTAARAWARVTINTTTGGMTVVAHDAMWGNANAVKPTPARSSQGIFTLTWPTSVADELGATHVTNLRGALTPNVRTTDPIFANVSSVTANAVTFAVWDASTVRSDGPYDVDIWVL